MEVVVIIDHRCVAVVAVVWRYDGSGALVFVTDWFSVMPVSVVLSSFQSRFQF